MDPALDPPPPAAQPAAALPATSAAAANPTPTQSPANKHPPYATMIMEAIKALNEPEGSSKNAISKFIETQYSGIPSSHSTQLTQHLKRLKTAGQLLMIKHSYKLPGSATNGAVDAVPSDPSSSVPKRRPGRPPKPKPDAVQDAVPVFAPPAAHQPQNVDMSPGTEYIAVEPVNGPPVSPPSRGRGRPPKRGGLKRGPGRPPSGGPVAGASGGSGRGRGRPKRNAAVAPPPAPAREKGSGRPRGRPPKPINVVEGFAPAAPVGGTPIAANVGAVPVATAPVVGKRRGRPAKAGGVAKKARNMAMMQPRKPRKFSGKPLGRPRKNQTAAVNRTPDSQLLVAYLDLKAKLENLQARVKQTTTFVRPFLNNEAAINAVQELEIIATNVNSPPNAQNQQQPQFEPSPPPTPPPPAPLPEQPQPLF